MNLVRHFLFSIVVRPANRRRTLTFLTTLLLGFFYFLPARAGGQLVYSEQAREFVAQAKDILIKRGFCYSRDKDCNSRQLIFWRASSSVVQILVYEVDAQTVQEIHSLAFTMYEEHKHKFSIVVEAYNVSHKDSGGGLFGFHSTKPFIHLMLEGEKK